LPRWTREEVDVAFERFILVPPPGAREFFWRGGILFCSGRKEGREHGLSASVRIQRNLKMSAIEDKMLVIVLAIIINW